MVSSEKEEVEDKDEFGGVLLRIIVKVLRVCKTKET